MSGGGGGEYEGVDEGEMEGLPSLLHAVGFFFYFPFQVLLCSSRSRQTRPERGKGK
jgi:hypothetical protein